MNTGCYMGRLVRDPEMKEFENGTILAKFTLAVKRFSKVDKVDYLPFQIWGEQAKQIGTTLSKGQRLAVYNCDIETSSYEDKDGNKHNTWWLNVGRFEYIEKKDE